MGEPIIPDAVQAFLLKYIDSVAQLEALLLLRTNATLDWTAEALAKRLYISAQDTAVLLERLRADGFVVALQSPPRSYRYQPASHELSHMVDRLADLYAKYLVPVTNLIHTKPRTRVQEFADAFRLRKGE
jgi:hypothetical protein